MKKIINGLRYDSENAIAIGTATNLGRGADSKSDFRWFKATLYRTKRSGRFFICGTGGPMSRFSQSVGQNSWSGGSDLIPMEREEALEFAEQYFDADVIEKYFADDVADA